jgi:hypothetical protein
VRLLDITILQAQDFSARIVLSRLRQLATYSMNRLRVSCDACLLASFLLSGSPSLSECECFIGWQPIRGTDCECLATLVCWRLFFCLEAYPSAKASALSIGNRFRWTDCACLATLVYRRLFCCLRTPPSTSAKASSIGNAIDGSAASVLRRLQRTYDWPESLTVDESIR